MNVEQRAAGRREARLCSVASRYCNTSAGWRSGFEHVASGVKPFVTY